MDEGNRTGARRRKGLGWKPHWDPRDGDHLMISHLRRDLVGVALPEEKLWRIGPILDQGEEGACVGYAWRAWMNARPIANDPERQLQARDIYLRAQLVDEFPGREPEMSGTSVRAGAKVMVRQRRRDTRLSPGQGTTGLLHAVVRLDVRAGRERLRLPEGPHSRRPRPLLVRGRGERRRPRAAELGRGPWPRGVRKGGPEDLELSDKPRLRVGLRHRAGEAAGVASPVRDLRGDRN